MRKFYDKDTDLHWYETENDEDKKALSGAINTINNWDSPGIRQYVVQDTPIADFMTYFINYVVGPDKGKVGCYCYIALDEENKPLGIVDVSTHYMTPERAIIEYLVVNPRLTGMGIGTRMIKSITHNTEWFAQKDKISSWEVDIDKNNMPSQRAFLKNRFVIHPATEIPPELRGKWSCRLNRYSLSISDTSSDTDTPNK